MRKLIATGTLAAFLGIAGMPAVAQAAEGGKTTQTKKHSKKKKAPKKVKPAA